MQAMGRWLICARPVGSDDLRIQAARERCGQGLFRFDARWRIAAAPATVGLLLCGALALTVRSRDTTVTASADASQQQADSLATERAVSPFWEERAAMDEFFASPSPRLAVVVRVRRLRFTQALSRIGTQSVAERADLRQAGAANVRLVAILQQTAITRSQPRGRLGTAAPSPGRGCPSWLRSLD
jgi:hypothetical protein